MTTELRVSIRNTSDFGGVAVTPLFTSFHDNSFDIYDLGGIASAGLEALAEDGNNSILAAELVAADADAQSANIAASRGPIAAGEFASATLDVDGASNGYLSVATMVLPSNDAFFGTANAVQLFDAEGNFLGAQTLEFDGDSVRDAGTEVNTERDAAFINQTAPNTGVTENGVVTVHPGFNGSLGQPGGEQIILGGTNAFGETVDPVAADFTRPDSDLATVHINTVASQTGGNGRDILIGGRDDDFIDGGNGADILIGGRGWDVLNGGNGRDIIKGGRGDDIIDGGVGNDILKGGKGNDDITGGAGSDLIRGGQGDDNLFGGTGQDFIRGGDGDDMISGGVGRDFLWGNHGNDIFVFAAGDGQDTILDFDRRGDDRLALDIDGVDSFEDIQNSATQESRGVSLDFDGNDSVFLRGLELRALNEADFLFL